MNRKNYYILNNFKSEKLERNFLLIFSWYFKLMMNYFVEDLNEEVIGIFYFNIGLLLLYFFFGLSGNGIVLFIYICWIKCIEERYFIFVLVIVDIFVILFGVVFGIVLNFYWVNYVIDIFCKVGFYLIWMMLLVFGIIILLIVLNCYLMICWLIGF